MGSVEKLAAERDRTLASNKQARGAARATPCHTGVIRARWVTALAIAVCAGCGDDGTQVEFWSGDGRPLLSTEQRVIEALARASVADARRHLPSLPQHITIRVRSGSDFVNPETGEAGDAALPAMVIWTVDPTHSNGALGVARTWLRAALFHELHHLVRGVTVRRATMLDASVSEGLATAFERDFANVRPAWGTYPAEVAGWVEELRALRGPPDKAKRDMWLSRHPDGRRWIGHRAGTYIADQARRRSGKTPADLVSVPTATVLQLAGLSAANRSSLPN